MQELDVAAAATPYGVDPPTMMYATDIEETHFVSRVVRPTSSDAARGPVAAEMLSTYGRLSVRRGVLARVFRARRRRRRPHTA